MLDKLEAIEHRHTTVGEQLTDPGVLADMRKFKQLNKEYKDLGRIVEKYHELRLLRNNIDNCKHILSTEKDEDLREMAKAELEEMEPKVPVVEEEIKVLLIPKDPGDEKNAIIEIRGGSGGDEASIFAGDLYRMYTRYCERRGWKVTVVDFTEGTAGGYKEVVMEVEGEEPYGILKYESGVHRVQRVPL